MIELNYKKMGSGQPMIILHGLFGSLDNWMTLGKKFSERHEVFLVDQRNHGQSEHTDEFSYDLLADDMRDLIQKENMVDPILVGHSMGGKTIMNFALRHRGMADKLIVVDAAPKKYPVHHHTIIQALQSLDFDTLSSRGQVDEKLSAFIPEPGVRQFLAKSIYWKNQHTLDLRFNLDSLARHIESISGWDLNEYNEHIPALFIRGGKSNYVSANDSSVDDHFGNAEIRTIENAGHWVHAEKPTELLEMVQSFTS